MARTRKTAQILRALKIQVATSSSSSDSDSLCEGTGPSLESLIDNEAAQDGVPYAQTLAADEDATADGRNTEVAIRGALSENDEGKDKQADPREAALCNDASQSGPDQASSSEEEKSSKVSSSNTSRGSRKRDIDDCDEELYYVPEIRHYHKNWKDLDRYLKKYQKQTRTVVSIPETQNVRLRNQNSMISQDSHDFQV
ncbi:hypothetical protein F443_09326 [Phytophthora nicotianae P1569]|uniref:Uncharacterized protein n=1 Tax=Phytophthora nicotianae P1569 TaxID=1317065 RepID=V9F688_PHYNI|nr:hypothetical protein F443_09326 [Phytophthora nicotianae P1569]